MKPIIYIMSIILIMIAAVVAGLTMWPSFATVVLCLFFYWMNELLHTIKESHDQTHEKG